MAVDSFGRLKEALIKPPVLIYNAINREFTMCNDARGCGLGVVLEQDGVVSYASRTLNAVEKNYSTIEKECLGVVFGAKQFRHYLLGRHLK